MPRFAMTLRRGVAAATLLLSGPVFAGPLTATLYKNPDCTCCEAYAKYLEQNGFKVTVTPTAQLHAINQKAGVPDALEGCHAVFINGYVIEGHVPADAIRKLLKQHPHIVGISIPGMPLGVPGMPGPRSGPITVYEIAKGATKARVFMTQA